MPTAAQRQRATALAQLNQQQQKPQNPHRSHIAHAGPSRQHPSATANADSRPSTSKLKSLEADWEDGTFSDEESDEEAAAFEMDGHDVWTQNYCAICDTLIEPGQGLIAHRDEQIQSLHSPTSSISRTSASGLKSKSGTIKARPPSSEGLPLNVKRTHSAGRIHGGAGAGTFGPSKRTGSAGSRLNALSELRPTTKMHTDSGKGKQSDITGSGTKSPALSRRSSTVSVRSGQSGGGASSSGPSSPISPNATLPRTKKGGILGTLTPAALKQQEELENAKTKAPPALYCSERCRQIDEQRSAGMGELVYYLQQPTSPSAAWQSGPSSYGTGTWSSRPSNSNVAALAMTSNAYGSTTPESECMCPDCLEKNSASGTVPSGASDTTESSTSFQYGPRGHKQRTTSGRIVTPQNLVPPGSHWSGDYFGNATARIRGYGTSRQAHVHRDSMSQAGTESSAKSSDSGSDMWEPRIHSGNAPYRDGNIGRTADAASVYTSEAGRGSTTTGTVTPEGVRESVERLSLNRGARRYSDRPLTRGSDTHASHNDSLSTSQASTTSPLRLLRQGDHRAMASVDVTSDVATSPQPYASSLLSRSMASERTEGGASSGFTVAAQPSSSFAAASLLERRQIGRPLMLDIDGTPTAAPELPQGALERFSDSPAPLDTSSGGSRAIGTLKHAQARASQHNARDTHHQRARTEDHRAVQGSKFGEGYPAPGSGSSNEVGATSGSWLRSSISAAWNTLRGLPSSDAGENGGRRGSSVQSHDNLAANNDDKDPLTPDGGRNDIFRVPDGQRTEEPTPTQSLIRRPTIKRGDVPAFASEIGRGEIPGERCDPQPAASHGWDGPDSSGLSKSYASAHGSIESERRRRKAERERALHRQQRSRDVTVLPPLLGVARPASSINLHGAARSHRTYSTASSRSDVPDSPLLVPVRSNTPGLRRGSSHSASLVGLQEYGSSPGRMAPVGSLSTSPRRAGLGWGALTPLGPPAEHRANLVAGTRAHHPHQPHQAAHHHGHGYHHHHGHHHSVHHPPHRSHGTIPLGTVGVLGAHPHGNAPGTGRHATTPVRMSTPRVPEDGGEMSAAELKGLVEGADDEANYRSVQPRSFNRRSLLTVPPRPQSVVSMRSSGGGSGAAVDQGGAIMAPSRPPSRAQTPSMLGHPRHTSSEDMRGAKMYPVLDVPNRQPTHDRYDPGWGLGETGLSDLLPSTGARAQQPPLAGKTAMTTAKREDSVEAQHAARRDSQAGDVSDRLSRKKLFYFDTS